MEISIEYILAAIIEQNDGSVQISGEVLDRIARGSLEGKTIAIDPADGGENLVLSIVDSDEVMFEDDNV